MRAHAQKDAGFFNGARARAGRPVTAEAKAQATEQIETRRDGRVGTSTGREKVMARAMMPQTRTVGVTSSDRAAVARTNGTVFDRLKAEARVEEMRKGKP